MHTPELDHQDSAGVPSVYDNGTVDLCSSRMFFEPKLQQDYAVQR